MILKLTNKSKNFYAHLGPVFGSREVQRVTGDRFYDDDEKEWYIYYQKGVPKAFVSVRDNKIKNVWGENRSFLVETLKEINKKVKVAESVVPVAFQKEYEESGFEIAENGFKNFIKIRGAKHE